MKIALVHNEYGGLSGEEVVVARLEDLLSTRGHEVVRFSRSSVEIPQKAFGRVQALFAGVYNPFSRRRFGRFLEAHRPGVVHIHNLFPFISPSILPECARRRVRVVMTLHNFRLLCPNALLMRQGEKCHECFRGRDWQCIRHNCERSLPKSIGYAVRTAFARRTGWFHRHVGQFICLTQFQKGIYAGEGFPPERMSVIPNVAPSCRADDRRPIPGRRGHTSETAGQGYVGYVGRVSPEKDVPALLQAARLLPGVLFKVAGANSRMPQLTRNSPSNVEFTGHLDSAQIEKFYAGMSVLAFATRCHESFPAVLLEAMAHGIPIVCTRIGGLPEIVEDGRTGLLYESGNSHDLAAKIVRLLGDGELRARLGAAGQAEACGRYSEDSVYQAHMKVYRAPPARSRDDTSARWDGGIYAPTPV